MNYPRPHSLYTVEPRLKLWAVEYTLLAHGLTPLAEIKLDKWHVVWLRLGDPGLRLGIL